ncbi:MAG: carboxypeptidase-like regulatory domain-containing protein [Bacteroidales bacterium]|nr:carboxypeptidase-like regulatory domain-containing protein [Bacteroidales bacterium]
MKKHLLLLFLGFYTGIGFGQVIRGRVVDKESGEPIDYASVYINGTFHGTTSDEHGEFEIEVTKYPGRPLYISAVSYHTTFLSTLKTEEFIQVNLIKVKYEIPEISIESPSLVRKRKMYLKKFKKEFLGSSKNAKACFILNEEAVTFNYHSSQDTIKAFAREPLIILNNSLGYRITYYLDKFEYVKSSNTIRFLGNISFNQDLATNSGRRQEFEERRKKTYLGSSKHFFNALWQNKLKNEGFRVLEVNGIYPLEYENFVMEEKPGKKYFSYPRDLEIAYDYYLTTVSFLRPRVNFTKDGYFEPEALIWYGNMSLERIADWLPYEYAPPE